MGRDMRCWDSVPGALPFSVLEKPSNAPSPNTARLETIVSPEYRSEAYGMMWLLWKSTLSMSIDFAFVDRSLEWGFSFECTLKYTGQVL